MTLTGPGRARSLRREWARAFAIMLVLLLVSAVATIVGVRNVVGQVRETAHRLHAESVTVAGLRTALVAHEQVGHQLLSGKAVNRAAYVRQQHELAARFDDAVNVFPATNGLRATVVEARRSWQSGLMTFGLWGDEVQALHGDHSAENPTYGASSDDTASLLDGLEAPSLESGRTEAAGRRISISPRGHSARRTGRADGGVQRHGRRLARQSPDAHASSRL